MSEEEMKELIQNAFQRTLKELKENPDNVFNYLELQEKYNGALKDKTKLQGENQELKNQLEAKEVQQKEFIEWLENEIKRMDKLMNAGKPKPYGEEKRLYQNSKVRYIEALSKYKSIIGS